MNGEVSQPMYLNRLETISKIVGFLAVAVGAIGALLQYTINSEAESRQRLIAELQSDIQISTLFSELVQTANGFEKYSEPQQEAIKDILAATPADMKQEILMSDPRNFSRLLAGSRISAPVPLGRQIAAAESLTNLAIKYPILLEPAMAGLDVVVGFLPIAEGAYDRLKRHYSINRPLTDWTSWNVSKHGMERVQPLSAAGTEGRSP